MIVYDKYFESNKSMFFKITDKTLLKKYTTYGIQLAV